MKCIIVAAVFTFVIAVQSSVIPISLAGHTVLTSSPGIVLAHPQVIAIAGVPEPNKSIAIHASTAPATAVIAGPVPAVIATHSLLEIAGPQPHAITVATAPASAVVAAPAPAVIAAHVPAVIAAPAPAIVAAEGQYVAETRGAVHVAPLPGHINSASSINLEAAPGTV